MPIFREKATYWCLVYWLSMLLSMLQSMYLRLEKATPSKTRVPSKNPTIIAQRSNQKA